MSQENRPLESPLSHGPRKTGAAYKEATLHSLEGCFLGGLDHFTLRVLSVLILLNALYKLVGDIRLRVEKLLKSQTGQY